MLEHHPSCHRRTPCESDKPNSPEYTTDVPQLPRRSLRGNSSLRTVTTLLLLVMFGHGASLATQAHSRERTRKSDPPLSTSIPDIPQEPFDYTVFLPFVQGNQLSDRTIAPLVWDSRLTERGAYLVPAQVVVGQGYWRLVEARWFNAQESEGRHHILIDVQDRDGQRLTAIPIDVRWRDGNAIVTTEEKTGEPFAANYAMYALAPAYSAQPADGAPADRVEGMGLGELAEPYLAHHTSYGLIWRWTIAGTSNSTTITPTPAIEATPPLTATPVLTTIPIISATPVATITPSPTVTNTLTSTPEPSNTLTPTGTVEPTASIEPTPTPPVTPTPTSTPTPTVTPTVMPTVTPTEAIHPYPFTALVGRCLPYTYGSRFSGTVSIDGAPVNGYRITFSYEPDGPHVPQQPAYSGSNGEAGAYSHILGVAVRRVGEWYAWMVDSDGRRISTIGAFHTDGDADQCNDATVDFYQPCSVPRSSKQDATGKGRTSATKVSSV
ncbi:MAG: hypothetical protein KDE47_13320 [Caldilineaceae bacterium]|nr:hypothetical protein [Caldilineaceae bacterium]